MKSIRRCVVGAWSIRGKEFGWVCLLLGLGLGFGCGGTVEPTGANQPEKEPDVVFRFALQPNPANKAWVAADLVRQELERRSEGRIKVHFYDSGVLGGERQILETCYLGVVEMVQCTSSVVTTLDPTFSLLDMPYLFINEDHHLRVMNGAIGQELLEGLRRHRLQGLAFYSCGFRHLFNRAGREIHLPEDLAGLKIRVMESPVMLSSIQAMGASATPLSAGELFQALKTGVVDGAENNPQVFVSERLYEAGCLNFSETRHFANQHVLVANREWFDRLGREHPDLRQLIEAVARDVIPEYNRQWGEAVEEARQRMMAEKVRINTVEAILPFLERVQPVYDEFFERHRDTLPHLPALVDRIRKEAHL